MKYQIELADTAKADIRDTAQWLRDQVSAAAADKWLAGLHKSIQTLEQMPLRCPLAAENDKFPQEIRELLYGRQEARKTSDHIRNHRIYGLRALHPPHRSGRA